MSTVRRGKRRAKHRVRAGRQVRIGAPDASLTGLVAVDELTARLGMVSALDAGIGPVKQRDRDLSGGQLLMAMATAQLAGQDCLAGLDRVPADAGSALLRAAPIPPSTTAASIAGRSPRPGWRESRPLWCRCTGGG